MNWLTSRKKLLEANRILAGWFRLERERHRDAISWRAESEKRLKEVTIELAKAKKEPLIVILRNERKE